MITLRLSLLATAFLLASTPGAFAINHPSPPTSCGGGPCEGDSDSNEETAGNDTSSGYETPVLASLEWRIKVGLARYAKPTSLASLSHTPYEKSGNLPDFKQIYSRFFPASPLQQRQVHLELSQVQISSATFHPSVLFMESEAIYETLKKPAVGAFPEYIHQILTDDAFTLINVLPAPQSGWRLRIWKRNAAPLTKSGGYYVTTGFETPPIKPLRDVTFMRPSGSNADNVLLYINKETTGLAGTRTITNEITQTLDNNGRALKVISKVFSGEGTGGPLLSKENLDYVERGTQNLNAAPKAWDYTIIREVHTASMDAAGTPGGLVLTRRSREDYADFSTEIVEKRRELMGNEPGFEVYRSHPQVVTVSEGDDKGVFLYYKIIQPHAVGGLPGMKRLVSLTEAYDVPGQALQVTSNSYAVDIPVLTQDPLQYLINPANGLVDENFGPPEPQNSLIHGRLKSSARPDGSWVFNNYIISPSNPVSIFEEYSSWNNVPIGEKENARKKVTTVSSTGSTVQDYVGDKLMSQSRTTLGGGTTAPVTTDERSVGDNSWLVTTTGYFPDSAGISSGRIKWIEHSDGTASLFAYATVSGRLVLTTRTGAGSRDGVNAGTEAVITYGVGNIPVAMVRKDIASNLEISRWTTDETYNSGFDAMGRPIKRIHNNDVNDFDITQYACCGLEESRGRDGSITKYSRDGLKRVYKVERQASAASPVVAEFTAIDGLTTTRTRRVGASATLFLGSTTRSLDGLTTMTTGPSRKSTLVADRPVTTSVTVRSATGDTTTTTHPDLSQSITAYYLDRRIKSVTGSAVPDVSYSYNSSINLGLMQGADGLTNSEVASGRQTLTYHDKLGRVQSVVLRGTGSSVVSITHYSYYPPTAPAGSRGNLQSVKDGDQVTVFYGYNAKGERTTTSRTIPLTGNTTATQVTTTERDVVSDVTLHGVSLGTSYRTTQTVASTGIAAVTTSQSYASIGGLVSGASSFGSQTLNIATRPDASGIATRTSIRPDGTQSVQTTTHGLVTTVQEKSTTGSVITGTSYTYDFFHRPETVTDLRTGPVTYSNFTEAGQPLTVTTNGNTDVTTTENDIMGRTIKTTLPDTTVTHTAYHPTGQVKATWGSQTYPTWNIYDEQGRQTQLHTWKIAPTLNPATIHLPTTITPPAGSDVTTWIYGPATGRLDRKQYADGKGTDYTYTAAGRLESRAWARGVTTTYGYTHGLMTSTNYSDNTTPDVTITYEPLGRQETVTQTNQSQITYTYDPANLALDTETIRYDLDHDGTYEFTRVLDRSRDSLQRDNGWQLKDGSTIENQATYGYHATEGHLLTVADAASSFAYGHVGNSNLVHTVTATAGAVHTVTNTWEPNRDVLHIKQNKVGTDIVSLYDYTVNSIGQRTGVAMSSTVLTGLPSWAWGYDSLGQVTSADSSVNTSDRAYEYDAIGNRKKFADSLTLPTNDNYVANSLNQYTAGTTATAVPVHDFDGNATAYPLPVAPATNSALGWDAQNRMISSTVGTNATTTYHYDSLSRRIAVTAGGTSTLFVYDGWNCVAEYTGTTLSKTRLWGTDLSGSMQGAGGVGGLLAERHHSGTAATYFPTYDGNGNVSEYLDSMGQVTAHFEYDPFGNLTVDSESNAAEFPYRFSTKPQDSTTGLYYYGYRWFDPVTGRWPSRDPIGERGGINLYGMCNNDPLNLVDYLGLNADIDAKIDEGGNEAVRLSNADQAQRQQIENDKVKGTKFHAATAPHYEYGGKVCCDDGTLYLSDIVTDSKVGWVDIGRASCGDDETVGTFHNHPNNSHPSDDDKRVARRGKPSGFKPDEDGDGIDEPVYDPSKNSIPPGLPIGATTMDGKTNIFDPKNGNPNSYPYIPRP